MFRCDIKTHIPKVLTDSVNKRDLGEQADHLSRASWTFSKADEYNYP